MDRVLDHPANVGVLHAFLRRKGDAVSIVRMDAFSRPFDAYFKCGSHPEIVERIWDQLGDGLPPNCRRVLCGTPVLVRPDDGVVLAVAYGTSYCLRIPDGALPEALRAGCSISHRWSNGEVTDLSEEFGPNWVFGCWARDESAWCRAAAENASLRPSVSAPDA